MLNILLSLIAAIVIIGSYAPYTESAAPTIPQASAKTITAEVPNAGYTPPPAAVVAASVHAAAATAVQPFKPVAVAATVAAPAPAPAPVPASVVQKATISNPDIPAEIAIPSIATTRTIIPVGLNAKGEMAVPSGSTLNVGWYNKGAIPGNMGSAVLDAHVFAAFSKLKYVSVGDDLYITDRSGQKLHFVVRSATTYALSDMDLAVRKFLFNKSDGRYLNLITCAGSLTADHSTYTHRLVIHAELVQ
jgi:sortase (surface protein transpeptidase)